MSVSFLIGALPFKFKPRILKRLLKLANLDTEFLMPYHTKKK